MNIVPMFRELFSSSGESNADTVKQLHCVVLCCWGTNFAVGATAILIISHLENNYKL